MSDFNGNNNEPSVPTIDKPEFEVPNQQPAQFSQPQFQQQMNFDQPVNMTSNMQPKKSKKKLVGIISAVVGVAACAAVAVIAGPKIMDAISKSPKGAPIDRFKNSITAASDDLIKSVKESDNASNKNLASNFNANVKLNLKLDNSIMSMVPEYAGLADTTLDMDIINKDKQCFFDVSLATPVDTAASMNGYYTIGEDQLYVQVPELSSAYLAAPMDFSDFDTSSLPTTPDVSNDEVANLLKDETTTFLNSIKEVTLTEDATLKASGIEAKYDKLSTTLTGTEFGEAVYNCYERLTKEQFVTEIASMYTDEFDGSIEDSLAELKNWASSNETGVTLDLYLNDDDEIMGFVLTPILDDEKNEIGYISAKDGETGYEFYVIADGEKQFSVEGKYKESKDSYTGNASVLTYEDGITKKVVDVAFEDMSCKDGKTKGSFTFTADALNGMSIKLDTDCSNKSGKLGLSVSMAGMTMGSLTLDYTLEEASTCPSLPADAQVFTEDQEEEFLGTADLYGFMMKFQNATGIDLQGLMSGF